MSTLPPESPASVAPPARGGWGMGAGRSTGGAHHIAARWTALHEAAAVVRALAGLAPQEPDGSVRNFPAAILAVGGWRRTLAEQGIADITAILQTGITALLAVHARGAGAAAPARALWNEFVAARDGIVALCPEAARERRLG